MEQTAVEWFYNELKNLIKESELTEMKPSEFDERELELINQAKEMEKQQQDDYAIKFLDWFDKNCYARGKNSYLLWDNDDEPLTSKEVLEKFKLEQYYNETFKSE